jgi:hypothetical protein
METWVLERERAAKTDKKNQRTQVHFCQERTNKEQKIDKQKTCWISRQPESVI